jgi:spermidine synthase
MPRPSPDRRGVVFALTFVVAFCSIVYELIYSELLSIVFGGTVVRYSITIGLFLFSLGVGAFLYRYLDDHPSNFFRLEVYLALAGPAGLVFIIGVNAFPVAGSPDTEAAIETVQLFVSHLPIVVVGLLSGLEIPFLTDLADAGSGEDGANEEGAGLAMVGALGRGSRTLARRAVGLVFKTATDEGTDERGSFSSVLGMDYLGSLVGTVTYALVLYPSIGLIPAVFVLGLLNAVAALVFYWQYRDADGRTATEGVTVSFGTPSRVLLAFCVLLSATYVGALAFNDTVETGLRNVYLEEQFEGEYPNRGMEVTITEHTSTRYQDVVLYERNWTGPSVAYRGPRTPQTCLRLDTALQLCDYWVESYHNGLVDVPMQTFVEDPESARVLVIGGGDWIPLNHLRAYNVTVDQVDLDREFMNYTKAHPFFERYHDDAYEYDRLNLTVGDGHTYLRNTDREYDLILLDLPGARSDDLLHLYSTEFYEQVRQHLTDEGVAVTWAYTRYSAGEHRKAYLNTVRAAGFESYVTYNARDDFNGDGDPESGEQFYVLAPGERPPPRVANPTGYVARHREHYASMQWDPIPRYEGVRPNSIFHPNYDIIVDR